MKKVCNTPPLFHNGQVGSDVTRIRPFLNHPHRGSGVDTLTRYPEITCVAARPLRHYSLRSGQLCTPVVPTSDKHPNFAMLRLLPELAFEMNHAAAANW